MADPDTPVVKHSHMNPAIEPGARRGCRQQRVQITPNAHPERPSPLRGDRLRCTAAGRPVEIAEVHAALPPAVARNACGRLPWKDGFSRPLAGCMTRAVTSRPALSSSGSGFGRRVPAVLHRSLPRRGRPGSALNSGSAISVARRSQRSSVPGGRRSPPAIHANGVRLLADAHDPRRWMSSEKLPPDDAGAPRTASFPAMRPSRSRTGEVAK